MSNYQATYAERLIQENTEIAADDHVIFVGPTSAIKNAHDIFSLRE